MSNQAISQSCDIQQFIATRCSEKNYSCRSVIITVFGDTVSQHGGWIWLGSLIEAIQPLGFSERLIRTSVFRLVQDDWLQVEKIGRKSYYAFTESASQQYRKAARRIYSNTSTNASDGWLLVFPSFVPESQMQSFKRQLRWLGFSSLASGTLAHPSIDHTSLQETLEEMNLTNEVIVMQSQTLDTQSEANLKYLVQERWDVSELEQQYQSLVEDYSALQLLQANRQNKLDAEKQFLLRTLLVHEYRRLLLKDHELPKSMLPDKENPK